MLLLPMLSCNIAMCVQAGLRCDGRSDGTEHMLGMCAAYVCNEWPNFGLLLLLVILQYFKLLSVGQSQTK